MTNLLNDRAADIYGRVCAIQRWPLTPSRDTRVFVISNGYGALYTGRLLLRVSPFTRRISKKEGRKRRARVDFAINLVAQTRYHDGSVSSIVSRLLFSAGRPLDTRARGKRPPRYRAYLGRMDSGGNTSARDCTTAFHRLSLTRECRRKTSAGRFHKRLIALDVQLIVFNAEKNAERVA